MYMTSIVAFVLLAVSSSYSTSAGSPQNTTSLCAIQEHPKSYAGRTVTVSAVLSSTGEVRAFVDEACPPEVNSHSGKHDLIEATFNQNGYDSKSSNHKRLAALLKKTQEAQVVVVATFIDPGTYVGHEGCCRYQLEIQKLISVKPVPKPVRKKHV